MAACQAVQDWFVKAEECLRDAAGPGQSSSGPVMGVDTGARDTFKLESSAWNNATFRFTDQQGWQPCAEMIDPSYSLDHALLCPLALQSICDKVSAKGFKTTVSSDPGVHRVV